MITRQRVTVRAATLADLSAIRLIYNQGIEDRVATLDTDAKTEAEIHEWLRDRDERYAVLVATEADGVVGWASLNRYSHRCAYDGVAELSVYVRRDRRGSGVGSSLLRDIERAATRNGFHKVVLFAFPTNEPGRRLYVKAGFRDVGTFREQGRLDGKFVDVIAMEKILKPLVLFVCKHNAGRSQMAEAYFRHFAGDRIEVASAGTSVAESVDPTVSAVMAEDGIDLSRSRPKPLDPALVRRALRVITMGCDVQVCDLVDVPDVDEDWGLPDPKGQSLEKVREIRDAVKAKAKALAGSYAGTRG